MAPKGKKAAPEAKVEEPPAKKAKAEDEPKKEEEPKKVEFEEADAPQDKRPAMNGTVGFETNEMSLNVIPTLQGKLLMSVTEGGMAYLMAGARANVAQKAGRYLYEAKIVQQMTAGTKGGQGPKQLLRVGFSTGNSTLMLGDDDQGVCFDADGSYISEKKRVSGSARIFRGTVVGIVLNLDPASENFNTVALYCDGKKVSGPKPLPECLKGKPLYPHVCYRNLSVNVNFGPVAMAELPFKCRMLQGAAQADTVATAVTQAKDGKYEVVMPVAFPDEGTFDWLDSWMEKNPKFVELSDRKIIDWARCSGMYIKGDRKVSNDKPSFNFQIPEMDNLSVKKLINIVAPLVPRNYIVMEVKSNLVAAERKETLKRFNNSCYKKVAQVVMGEPNKEFKTMVQNKLLKDKQVKADADFKVKKADAARKKAAAKRQKELLAQRKKAEDEKAAKAKEAAEKKAKEEAEKKAKEDAEKAEKAEKEGEEKKEGDEEKKAEEPKAEEKTEEKVEEKAAEEPKKEEAVEEKEEEEEADEEMEPPVVELTDEEKKQNFLPKKWPDLEPRVLSSSFGSFSAPEKSEGFDDVRYEWDSGDKTSEYMKAWVQNKKLTIRLDDLKPGEFFRGKAAEFHKAFSGWQETLKNLDPAKKPVKKEGDDDAEELDVLAVKDVNDIGEGCPLFASFADEDWALLRMRFELHMLTTSFKKDCNDPDRKGIPEDHVAFYYGKYFNKGFSPGVFGCAAGSDLYKLLKDTVAVEEGLLITKEDEEMENFDIFVKLVESARRERERRIEAGDETARVKFNPAAQTGAPRQESARVPHRDFDRGFDRNKGKGKDFGKGFDKGKGKGKPMWK